MKKFCFHKWVKIPISFELIRFGVIDRKACIKCDRTFIKKEIYKNFLGILVWKETKKYNEK